MSKEVKYNNSTLYNIKFEDSSLGNQVCTIENLKRDEYGVYHEEGEGFLVQTLDTIDIVELLSRGSIVRAWGVVSPFSLVPAK